MKYIFIFLGLLLQFNIYAQVKINELKFESDYIDLGELDVDGGTVLVTFKFKNTSEYYFISSGIEVSCGCTSPRISQKRIAPGDSGEIIAAFDPKGQLGNITKWLHLRGNFSDGPYKELRFKALVDNNNIAKDPTTNTYYPGQYGYLLIPQPYLYLGEQTERFSGYDSFEVINDGYRDLTIESMSGHPGFITTDQLPFTVKPNERRFLKFRIDLSNIDTIGHLTGNFELRTNDHLPVKLVTYSIDLQSDFSKLKRRDLKKAPVIGSSTKVVDMGPMRPGQIVTKKITITNSGKTPLIIRRVDEDCSCTVLGGLPSSIAPGESVEVSVKFDAIFRKGPQRKAITIYTNDPSQPKYTLLVISDVE